jgi:protocatechuate 3,4-dioxygenase beta subunit
MGARGWVIVVVLAVAGGVVGWLASGGGEDAGEGGLDVGTLDRAREEGARPGLVGTPGATVPGTVTAGSGTWSAARPGLETGRGRIVGRITDAQRQPVAGATVAVRPHADGGPTTPPAASGETDADGNFALERLGEAGYLLVVSAPGRIPVSRRVSGGAEPLELTLEVEQTLAGRVVAGDAEEPVVGIMVFARPFDSPQAGAPHMAATDEEGRFRIIGVAPGEYLLTYGPGGTANGIDLVTGRHGPVASGAEDILVRAERGRPIRGTVRDRDGLALPGGFAVFALREGTPVGTNPAAQRHVVVAADGTFHIPGLPPGRYTLSFGPGFSPQPLAPDAEAAPAVTVVRGIWAGTEDLEVTLVRGVEMRGRVIDEQGQGVHGDGYVYVYPVGEHAGVPGSATVKTDESGRFRTPRLDPAQPYTVFATGYAGAMAVKEEGVHAGEQEILLRTKRASVITGRVLDPDGKPVLAGVGVQAMATGSFDRSEPGWLAVAYTRADGTFQVEQLGAHTFRLVAGGGPTAFVAAGPPVTAVPGAADVTLQARRGRRVGGRLLDAAGQPLQTGNLSAWAVSSIGGLPNWIAVNDPDGRYLFPGLPQGGLRFGLNHEGAFVTLRQTPTADGGIDLRLPE